MGAQDLLKCIVFKDFSPVELTRLIGEFLRQNNIVPERIFKILQSSEDGKTVISIWYI